jgi:hypothetical protein
MNDKNYRSYRYIVLTVLFLPFIVLIVEQVTLRASRQLFSRVFQVGEIAKFAGVVPKRKFHLLFFPRYKMRVEPDTEENSNGNS